MPPTISAPVGKKATNFPSDVRTVQTLLNGFVAAGRMGSLPLLAVDGDPKPTVPYIETFQKKVAGFNNPDGKIESGKNTWTRLIETPDGVAEFIAAFNMVHAATFRPPPERSGMPEDLWQAGLASLMDHIRHIALYKPEIVTFMDFRIDSTNIRLWTVDIRTGEVHEKAHVAHGKGSGTSTKAKKFDNRDYKTALGAYITKRMGTSSKLGDVKGPEPTLDVIGLEPKINDRAENRGIKFHAATYVNPPWAVGPSEGCFATAVDVNRRLMKWIPNGSFAYAYAG